MLKVGFAKTFLRHNCSFYRLFVLLKFNREKLKQGNFEQKHGNFAVFFRFVRCCYSTFNSFRQRNAPFSQLQIQYKYILFLSPRFYFKQSTSWRFCLLSGYRNVKHEFKIYCKYKIDRKSIVLNVVTTSFTYQKLLSKVKPGPLKLQQSRETKRFKRSSATLCQL